jgi:membrane protein DedA with SNARE-associated domain
MGDVAGWVDQLMATYGLWAVFVLIFLESSGVPLPGETALVAASIYASTTGNFALWQVIGTAIAAAVIGDSMGYLIGRKLGLPLLERWGRKHPAVGKRVRVGEYMFARHGGKIVFFGRWVALLRVLAAVLAGATRMPWRRFVVMNALGGICWAIFFGGLAYAFGQVVLKATEGPIGYVILGLTIAFLVGFFFVFRRYEHKIMDHAIKEMERIEAERADRSALRSRSVPVVERA